MDPSPKTRLRPAIMTVRESTFSRMRLEIRLAIFKCVAGGVAGLVPVERGAAAADHHFLRPARALGEPRQRAADHEPGGL